MLACPDQGVLHLKGKHFSIKGLLADNSGGVSKKYESGSLAVFRLAPQVRMGTGHHRRANADVWIQVVTFILLFCLLILSHQAAPRMRSPLEIKTGLPARNQDVSPGKGVTRRTALVLV